MTIVPGAHFFNQPHHKTQKERNRNEQRERKKQQPCSPQPLLPPLPPQGGRATSGAQGWVPGRSARQTTKFHFLSTPELRQDVWGHDGGPRVGQSTGAALGFPLAESSMEQLTRTSTCTPQVVQSRPMHPSSFQGLRHTLSPLITSNKSKDRMPDLTGLKHSW